MKYKVEEINKCTKKFSFEVGEDSIKQAYNQYYDSVKASAVVPGFRKGKAPRNVLENYFKSEAQENVVRTVVSNACQDAFTKEKISTFGMPSISDVEFKGSSITFQATVELRPNFEIKKYKEIKVKKNSIKIENKEVDETIDKIRSSVATYKVIEGRSVNIGDFITADSKCEIGGKVVDDKKDEKIELNEQYLLPEYVKNIVGAKVGDTKEFDITFPDTIPQKEYQGKIGHFTLQIKEIQEKVLPELDEKFLKSMGNYEKAEDLRDAIEKDIKKQKENSEEQRIERELLDKICKDTSFEVPQSLVDERTKKLKDNIRQTMLQRGLPEDSIDAEQAKVETECVAEAIRQVKVAFILDKIATLESISVTDDDVSGRFYELSRQYRQPVDTIRDYYEKNDLMESLKAELRNDKTVDVIKNTAIYS
ncbi:trigger factor [Candidatus Omnitrophota bacterium]